MRERLLERDCLLWRAIPTATFQLDVQVLRSERGLLDCGCREHMVGPLLRKGAKTKMRAVMALQGGSGLAFGAATAGRAAGGGGAGAGAGGSGGRVADDVMARAESPEVERRSPHPRPRAAAAVQEGGGGGRFCAASPKRARAAPRTPPRGARATTASADNAKDGNGKVKPVGGGGRAPSSAAAAAAGVVKRAESPPADGPC